MNLRLLFLIAVLGLVLSVVGWVSALQSSSAPGGIWLSSCVLAELKFGPTQVAACPS